MTAMTGLKIVLIMKKINYILLLAAAAAFAFTSCEVNEPSVVDNPTDIEYVNVEIGAEIVEPMASKVTVTPNEGDTAFDSAWSTNDNILVHYNVVASDTGAVTDADATATWSGSSFSAELPNVTGNWQYFACYPTSAEGNVGFGSNREQTGNAYNSIYDLMLAPNVKTTDAAPGKDSDGNNVVLPMERKTAVVYFHFTSALDEAITKATLSVTGGNIAAETVALSPKGFSTSGPLSEIVLTTSGQNAQDFKLWFNVLPTEYSSMSLTVETENKTFTINKRSTGAYEAGKLYKAIKSVNWTNKGGESDEPQTIVVDLEKSGVSGGSYVNGTFDVDGVTFGYNNWLKNKTSIQAKKSTDDSFYNVDAIPGTITKITVVQSDTPRAIIFKGGIASQITPGEITTPETASTMVYDFTGKGYNYFTMDTPSNACYIESITIEYIPGTVKTISSIAVSGTPDKTEYTEGDAFEPAGLVVTATYDDGTTSDVTENAEWTITPTELAAGTTSVSVTAKVGNLTSEPYVVNGITVNEIPALTTIEQIFNAATATATDTKITFNNWIVSGASTKNAYVTDGTNGFIIFTEGGHGFEEGDILSGTLTCTLVKYNGSAEIKDITNETEGIHVTKGGVITPKTVAVSTLGGINTGVVLTYEAMSYKSDQTLSDGENTIKPYKTIFDYGTLTVGQKYNVTGVYLQYNSTQEILPRSTEDIAMYVAPSYAINISEDIENGTVTASAEEAQAGVEVTLTATPADGYRFVSWSVKDADDADVNVTNNKFTMPAKAVTVSATFELIPTHTVTIGSCTNGSVSASIAGTPITSGSYREGTVIDIVATPSTDYKFKSWSITGATPAASTASTTITIGTENITIAAEFELNQGGTPTTCSIDFSKAGYGNGEAITSVDIDSNVSVIFDKGSSSNAPSYYNTGTAVRAYAKNSITISSTDKTIKSVKFTFGSGDGSNAISANVGSYESNEWSGSSSSVEFTIGGTSGHRRVKIIEVTYE